MAKRSLNIILAGTSLLLGGIIYLMLRPNTQITQISQGLSVDIALQTPKDSVFFCFLKYYLVDFLWCFSLSCGLTAILLPEKTGVVTCSATGVALGIIWEIFQYTEIVNGTGDVFDVLMYLLAGICCILTNKESKGEEK